MTARDMARTTNIHTHIFNGLCAPDYFLRVALPRWLRWTAPAIKALLQNATVRKITHLLARTFDRGHLSRYIQFIDIGTQNAQEDVFNCMRAAYVSLGDRVRFVGLTLNMDHMDVHTSRHACIEDQLAEIERVRGHYRDQLFPFVSVDPRHLAGPQLVAWVREKIERRAFYGIKLYPSLGFFPFDPRLDALYEWAQANRVPVMTHCTRSGTFYTGDMGSVVLAQPPASLNPGSTASAAINARVKAFMATKLTRRDPKYGCNIFLHPQNYEPVLEKYPELKICFAHFGGSDEMLGKSHPVRTARLDTINWHQHIKTLMGRYPNVYTDISYTLSDERVYPLLKTFLTTPSGDRLLFGTDYYMTLQEQPETWLWERCIAHIGMQQFDRIAQQNTDRYLQSQHFNPLASFN